MRRQFDESVTHPAGSFFRYSDINFILLNRLCQPSQKSLELLVALSAIKGATNVPVGCVKNSHLVTKTFIWSKWRSSSILGRLLNRTLDQVPQLIQVLPIRSVASSWPNVGRVGPLPALPRGRTLL
jgi:hypothetical protein